MRHPDYHADERFEHRAYIDDAVGDESIRAILGVPMTVSGRVVFEHLTTPIVEPLYDPRGKDTRRRVR